MCCGTRVIVHAVLPAAPRRRSGGYKRLREQHAVLPGEAVATLRFFGSSWLKNVMTLLQVEHKALAP